jgi:uncharacterized ferritin-like protein (DUF455 family)
LRHAAASLNQLAYLERATAHIQAGWIPKLPDMSAKVELGQEMFRAMDRASQINKRMSGLLRANGVELAIPHGWRNVMRQLDGVKDEAALFAGLYSIVLPALAALYATHLSQTDILGDGPSLPMLQRMLPELKRHIDWGTTRLSAMPSNSATTSFCVELQQLWNTRHTSAEIAAEQALWNPLDRVPAARRPPGLTPCEPGSLGLLTVDSVNIASDVAIFLHSDLDEEFTTLELMARNSYEHPNMPWQFHMDMARQVSDEARHALLIQQLLNARGFHYGDFDISTSSYDGLYAFEPCEPGSEKELLWRILIRQTFMEGLALDFLGHDIKRRQQAGQHDIAQALEYILADEVFHAGSGLRWAAHLLGGDRRAVLQERYESLTYYAKRAEALRQSFAVKNPEKAMGELVIVEEGKRRRGGKLPDRPLNRLGRVQAGYSDDDILQILSWGYATE